MRTLKQPSHLAKTRTSGQNVLQSSNQAVVHSRLGPVFTVKQQKLPRRSNAARLTYYSVGKKRHGGVVAKRQSRLETVVGFRGGEEEERWGGGGSPKSMKMSNLKLRRSPQHLSWVKCDALWETSLKGLHRVWLACGTCLSSFLQMSRFSKYLSGGQERKSRQEEREKRWRVVSSGDKLIT